MSDEKAKQIAELNDRFRADFYVPSFGPRPVPGHIVCTRGIDALPPETQIRIWAEVAKLQQLFRGQRSARRTRFRSFQNGRRTRKDFLEDRLLRGQVMHSEDPADPARSFRILTIMLASEY